MEFFLRLHLLHHDRLNCNPIWVAYIFSLIFKRLKSQWTIKYDTADAPYVKWIQMNVAIFWILLCNHAEVCKINELARVSRCQSCSQKSSEIFRMDPYSACCSRLRFASEEKVQYLSSLYFETQPKLSFSSVKTVENCYC